MKCTYCGHELSDGSEFCDNCGMILGFGDEEKTDKKADAVIEPENTPNIFMAIDLPEDEDELAETAMELPVSANEETVQITENIPEYVSEPEIQAEAEEDFEFAEETEAAEDDDAHGEPELAIAEGEFEAPEYTPLPDVVIAPKKSSDKVRTEQPKKPKKKREYKESYNIESIPLKEDDEPKAPTVEETVEVQSAEEVSVSEPAEEVVQVVEEEAEEVVPVGIFEDITSGNEETEIEEYEDITPVSNGDDTYVKGGKKGGKGLAFAVIVAVLCVIAVGAYALREIIPVVGPTEKTTLPVETSDVIGNSEAETTEAETTEEETTEEVTTEEETTEEQTTEEETTEEEITTEESTSQNVVVTNPTTTKPTTTKPTTTKPTTTKPTTTKPTTTKPTTTKPTTTKPTTTKPTTTKPTTTKPTTTDPYGINNVTVKKPASYIKSYTGYATAEGVNLRSGPAASYARVLYLSKGADLKVLAKENGFLYVYSNRYGVYGWVSASYVSAERPQAETSTVHTGTVSPDVSTKSKTMHTTYSLNIRKGPSTKYESVQIIPTGYPVKVTGYKSGVSGWVYVTDLTYGVSGWVSSAYLK